MADSYLAPIVEGHGEVEALPALLHRIAREAAFHGRLQVNPPIRVKSASFLEDEGYFSKQITLAAAKAAQERGSVLILLDCDDGCPATLGPELLRRARSVRPGIDILVALAYREYETWFVAAARSLGGLRGIPDRIEPPSAPDAIRNAKGWLADRMTGGYDPVTHQLEFTRRFEIAAARTNRSFDRFYRRICDLLAASSASSAIDAAGPGT